MAMLATLIMMFVTGGSVNMLTLAGLALSVGSMSDCSISISENTGNDKYYWMIDPLKNERQKRLYALSCTHHIYGILMRETLNSEQQIIHFKEAKRIAVQINNPARSLLGSLNLGRIYLETGKPDSALLYLNDAVSIAKNSGREKYLASALVYAGNANMNKGDTAAALNCFYQCIESAMVQNNIDGLTRGYHRLADFYLYKKNNDSSLYYSIKSLEAMKRLGAISQIEYNTGDAYEGVYKAYRLKSQLDSAYKYLALSQTASDSISHYRIQSLAEFQKLTLSEQQRLQNIEKERVVYQNRVRTYFLLFGIGVLLLLAIVFYRNNRQKQKAKIKIEQAYDNLKATQAQLIQSEKMASLGELTAGIAHEIQNPLNFVNNFSEINAELIDELQDELKAGKADAAISISNDIKENEQKISHHGKRADAIVKGMLQHSKSSTGTKESIDINKLADEYLRLSYHGLKAKDKNFTATIKTDFDETVEKINIIPQDIGRVLLNLYNNAFYAVAEEKKRQGDIYEPSVSVSTNKTSDHIFISVKDDGNGIPQNIVEKIFQPFFTTKPTGQGTGLGLSLSYDIIKAHGGEIKVETKGGEGTTFIISLPLLNN